jgi:hypothetical protein
MGNEKYFSSFYKTPPKETVPTLYSSQQLKISKKDRDAYDCEVRHPTVYQQKGEQLNE